MKSLLPARKQERDFLMLPDDFDFAMLPEDVGTGNFSLKEIGMLSSTIEDIDKAMVDYVENSLDISTTTNQGTKTVPVLWQTPERAYQIKNDLDLRDSSGALTFPLITVERTSIIKDPAKKGSFQAHLFSNNKDGRAGRMTIARRIVPDKTRNFAVASGTRNNTGVTDQKWYPRVNKKIVVQTVSIPIPVYVSVDYKILLKTEYQQQMNDMLAPFIARTGQINAFTMKRRGHRYEAFIQQGFSHNNNVSNLAEDARNFTTEVTINVLGYLIGEGNSDDRPIVEIKESAVEFRYPTESVHPVDGISFFED